MISCLKMVKLYHNRRRQAMKHAYLILAHNQEKLLIQLLHSLDVKENDIYLHIDKRSEIKLENISESVHNAKVEFVNRISVEWGGYSMIEATMILLKAATKTHHIYYHLLSGVDLPLKSINQINSFYEKTLVKNLFNFLTKRNVIRSIMSDSVIKVILGISAEENIIFGKP